jgi:hypothetical protein
VGEDKALAEGGVVALAERRDVDVGVAVMMAVFAGCGWLPPSSPKMPGSAAIDSASWRLG